MTVAVPAINETHTMLADLGIITHRTPEGAVIYIPDNTGQLWKTIGRITISCYTALIDVWPCAGPHIGETDLDALKERAVSAWKNAKAPLGAWAPCWNTPHGPAWEQTIRIPVTGFGPIAINQN